MSMPSFPGVEPRPVRNAPSEERLLVPDSRGGLDGQRVVFCFAAGFIHLALGLTVAEFLKQSPAAVAILSMLAILTSAGVMLRPNADRFEAFRAMSFYYFVAFCVAPLALPLDLPWHYTKPTTEIMTSTALLALFAYILIAIGYHFPTFRPIPRSVPLRERSINTQMAASAGLALFAVGVVGYSALFVSAGGVAVILQGQGDLHRTDFSVGLGVFFWLAMLMNSGGAIYLAAMAARSPRGAWIHAWPLFSSFVLLLLLQGRHRAIGPIIIALVILHYLSRRIPFRRLIILGVAGASLAIFVGVARTPILRPLVFADPIRFVAEVVTDYPDHVQDLLVADLSRVVEVMIVVDKIPAEMNYWNGFSFLTSAGPFMRLMGLGHLAPKTLGQPLYFLARPELLELAPTGFLPSFVGEMRANFPWYVCSIPFFFFGMLLRWAYQSLLVNGRDPLSVAAYALIGLFMCNSIIGTFNQNLFEYVVIVVPVLVTRALTRRSPRRDPLLAPSAT